MADQSLPPSWEKLKIVSTLLATVLIPIVIAAMTQWYTSALKDNEIGVKYVEIALGILRTPPDPQTKNLRTWAIAVVNQHSRVPLSGEAQMELTEKDVSNLLKRLQDMSMTPIPNYR